jgi:hypothetical protein
LSSVAGGNFGSGGKGNVIGVSVGVRVGSRGVNDAGVRGGLVPPAGALRIGSSEADAAGLLPSTVAVAIVLSRCRWRRRCRLLAGAFAVLLWAGRLHIN